MKILSAAPFSTTFVSPVTIWTPASAAVLFIDKIILSRVSYSNPSSIINPQEINNGFAPITDRSFIVPATASFPMSPPGKNRGLTT